MRINYSGREKNKNIKTILLFLLFLLFSAALKDDSGAIADSEFWSDLVVHPLVTFAKKYSYVFLLDETLVICLYSIIEKNYRI